MLILIHNEVYILIGFADDYVFVFIFTSSKWGKLLFEGLFYCDAVFVICLETLFQISIWRRAYTLRGRSSISAHELRIFWNCLGSLNFRLSSYHECWFRHFVIKIAVKISCFFDWLFLERSKEVLLWPHDSLIWYFISLFWLLKFLYKIFSLSHHFL